MVPVRNAVRKEDVDHKVVVPVRNAVRKEDVDPVHNGVRRPSEVLSLEGLGGVAHVAVSFG